MHILFKYTYVFASFQVCTTFMFHAPCRTIFSYRQINSNLLFSRKWSGMESPTYSEYFSLIIEGATRRRLAMAGPSTPPASPPSRDGETEGAGAKRTYKCCSPAGKNTDRNTSIYIPCFCTTYKRNRGDMIWLSCNLDLL